MDFNDERSLAHPKQEQTSFGWGFFRVVEEKQGNDSLASRNEIILDSGPFLTWLAISPNDQEIITYQFGTLTKEPNAVIRFLYPLHIWYSKLLLISGARHHISHWSSSSSSSTTKS
jgi:hypothetical protein